MNAWVELDYRPGPSFYAGRVLRHSGFIDEIIGKKCIYKHEFLRKKNSGRCRRAVHGAF